MVFAVGGFSVPIFWLDFLLIFVVLRCFFHIFMLKRRPERQGGGLVRSLGGWAAIQALRRGRGQYAADERVLRRSAFVATRQQDLATRPAARRPPVPWDALVARVCAALTIPPTAWHAGSRRAVVCRARADRLTGP